MPRCVAIDIGQPTALGRTIDESSSDPSVRNEYAELSAMRPIPASPPSRAAPIVTSTSLGSDSASRIQAVFYDFDRTLVVSSFGEEVLLKLCDPDCNYESCECTGTMDMTDALASAEDARALVLRAFGGEGRLARLQKHLDLLKRCHVDVYMISTSWFQVPANAWSNFIWTVFKYANIQDYFGSKDAILTLDDPGEALASDKGASIRTKMDELGLNPNQAIFADDSHGNILSASCSPIAADTLYVQGGRGLQEEDFVYIEGRVVATKICEDSV